MTGPPSFGGFGPASSADVVKLLHSNPSIERAVF